MAWRDFPQICNPASRSQRLLAGGSERIVVGDVQAYEARCRKCFSPAPV